MPIMNFKINCINLNYTLFR